MVRLCVLQVEPEDSLVSVTLLHPGGPCSSFRHPTDPDIHTLSTRDVLTNVDPRTRTGRVYTLSKKEIKTATETLTKFSAQLHIDPIGIPQSNF